MKSQALVAYGRPLEEIVSPTPVPKGTEVLVTVSHAGVCHSDIHLQDGGIDLGDGDREDWRGSRRLPHTPGHEIEGTLAAVGPHAEALLEGRRVGQRFVVFPWNGCGQCPACRRDQEHLCARTRSLGFGAAGGYADHVLVPHPRYLLDCAGVPEGLAATYMCSGVTAFSALKKAGHVGPGDAILIVGLGGVGMMGLQFARAMFPQARVLGADIDPKKRHAAMAAGAAGVYSPEDAGTLEQLRAETGDGVAYAVDFVGSTTSFGFANRAIRRGGAVIVVGLFGGKMSAPTSSFPGRPFSIIGSLTGSLGEAKEMMALVQAGKVAPIPIEMRPLSDANRVLDQLREGSILGRVVLQP